MEPNFGNRDVMLAWKPIIGNRVTTNKPLDVVALLDSEKVEATSVWVLSRRGSDRLPSLPEYYDPSFLLALFLRLIQQGEPMVISTWQSIARAGLLGLAMCALSSDMAAWRFLGDRCLAKSSEKLKALEHMDASEILLPMEHFRYLHLLRKAVSHNQACVKLISKPGLLKVLEQFKPSSKREWKEVMNILQEVASRMPLFHKAIARETVENVISSCHISVKRNIAPIRHWSSKHL
ncbi:hypothetical protein PSHT_05920 [Puccinia striiformis]|uniref:Uncharacterized protein n=1 Tax=Puccinia striiformis TaxID=27350 RepID=A0A2S4W956_9BASI|nr:hypothetical protein PSHT_05920 [Puccinia striiformis]